jgi:N-acetylglucosamine repressor
MKAVNRKNEQRRLDILRCLLDHGELSLSKIARQTHISLPVVTTLIGRLNSNASVIRVKDSQLSHVGRPPAVYRMNGESGYMLGIDLGRIYTNCVALNLAQKRVAERSRQIVLLDDDERVVDKIEEEVRGFADEANIRWKSILGIGFSIPGLVRGETGVSETYLRFGDEPLRNILVKRFKKPIRIEHDVKAMTWGEVWFGSARGKSNALVLDYGWGLGVGILTEGKLHYGHQGYAGEFGHIPMEPNGRLCYCGKKGCLETLSSGRAIAETAVERLSAGATSMVRLNRANANGLDPIVLLQAANKGDQFAIEIIEEAGRYLGQGIAILINIFNPETIIIGGDVSSVAEHILNSIKSTAMKHSLVQLNKSVEFEISKLGRYAAASGVARLVTHEVL